MTKRVVSIEVNGLSMGSVELDGEDVSDLVYGFEVSGEAGSITEVILKCRPDAVSFEGEPAEVLAELVGDRDHGQGGKDE